MATETWVINNTFVGGSGGVGALPNYTVNFESNGTKNIGIVSESETMSIKYTPASPRPAMPAATYGPAGPNIYHVTWNAEAYRTITLDEPATGDFLDWLQANAVKQGGGEPVLNLVDRTALDNALTATADAIRAKTGGTGDLTFDLESGTGFEDAIETIPVAKQEQSKTLTLGANAPQTVTPDSGKVLSSVPVVLDTSVIKAENIAKDVQMLGITGAHEGSTAPVLITKTVTANGTYNASADNADGYSQVVVAIPVYDGSVV